MMKQSWRQSWRHSHLPHTSEQFICGSIMSKNKPQLTAKTYNYDETIMKVFIPGILFSAQFRMMHLWQHYDQEQTTMDSQDIILWWYYHEGIYTRNSCLLHTSEQCICGSIMTKNKPQWTAKTYNYDETIMKVFILGISYSTHFRTMHLWKH